METINSILDVYQDNWIILIGDQNKKEDWSFEKSAFYHSACAEAHKSLRNQDRIKVHGLPFDCGLPYARNELVKLANNLGIKYCLMSADSIKFTESIKKINYLVKYLNHRLFDADLIGLELLNRISWEAWLDVKEAFILDFIDKTKQPDEKFADLETMRKSESWIDENGYKATCGDVINFWKCSITRNFFLATTKSLLDVPWDENVKMSEHEDFFWRYKLKGYNVGWTDYCNGKYIKTDDNTYKKLRTKNMAEGKKYFMEKYNLKKWFEYINLQNIKR